MTYGCEYGQLALSNTWQAPPTLDTWMLVSQKKFLLEAWITATTDASVTDLEVRFFDNAPTAATRVREQSEGLTTGLLTTGGATGAFDSASQTKVFKAVLFFQNDTDSDAPGASLEFRGDGVTVEHVFVRISELA